MVIDFVRVEIEFGEFVDQQVQSFVLMEFLDQRTNGEVLYDIQDILGVPLNIVIEVHQDIGRVTLDSREVKLGGIEERRPDLPRNYWIWVRYLVFILSVEVVNLVFLGFKNTI